MQNCTQAAPTQQLFFDFPGIKKIVGAFDGPELSSDGGLILTKAADEKYGICKSIACCLIDPRDPSKVQFSYEELIKQRINMIMTGNEDLNDADRLFADRMHKIAAGRNPESGFDLASDSTLERLEVGRCTDELDALDDLLVHSWIKQQRRAPFAITIDLDGTDHETHGGQQLSLFNGYYGHTCYQPLFGFIGAFPIIAKLRPGTVEPADGALEALRNAVKILKTAFPKMKIYLRADAGFARPEIYEFCERSKITYYIGLPSNSRLDALAGHLKGIVKRECLDLYGRDKAECSELVRVVQDISYAAKTWFKRRRVIARCDLTEAGTEIRYVVTNARGGRAQWIYEEKYCKRARCENYIKEAKALKSDRLSCHEFKANRFRLLMHTFAYIILHTVREAFPWSERESTFSTIRLRFIKLAVQIKETARQVVLSWPSSYPAQAAFAEAYARLTS